MPSFDEIEFRTFDYDGFKESLFDIARTEFPEWTDILESNNGVMFIEWIAFVAANLAWMQNYHARQHFVPTVNEAQNLTKLAKQFDYQIPSNVAASVDLTFSTEDGDVLDYDLIIPEGTQARTAGETSLIFETTDDLTIPSGAASGTVSASHQVTRTETETSDGSSDYRSALHYSPYIEDTMAVTVDSVDWVEVDNFLDSDGNSEHFRLEVDSDGLATVIFGDNNNGKIPASGSSIVYTYKVGGGADGNVSPGTISILDDTFTDTGGNPVSLVVTNSSASQGGVDREDIETSKIRIPKSIAAKEVTIDYNDFEAVITSVSGVSRVRILTVNDNPYIEENTVLAVVLPDETNELTEALENQIETALTENPPPLTQRLILAGPQFVNIPIEIRDLITTSEFTNDLGVAATGSVTLLDNVFDVGDTVTVNGVDFVVGVDWAAGGDLNASANNLATVIEVAIPELSAEVDTATVNLTLRTPGAHGNDYTLSVTDGATTNFSISGSTFADGEDSTVQAAIRAAIEAYFGRENTDEDGDFTVGFGTTVYRNRIIWLVQDVEGVESFNLAVPATDTEMDINEFPTYSLSFTTS